MTDTSADRPFNGFFTPTPYRIPNLILWGSGTAIGFGLLAIGYFSGSVVSSLVPMMILICASALVSGCTLIAYKQDGGRLTLYFGAAMLVLLSGWIAFDEYQTRTRTRAADRQLASDLIQACQTAGGERLVDPACAEQLRILHNYYDARSGRPIGAAAP